MPQQHNRTQFLSPIVLFTLNGHENCIPLCPSLADNLLHVSLPTEKAPLAFLGIQPEPVKIPEPVEATPATLPSWRIRRSCFSR